MTIKLKMHPHPLGVKGPSGIDQVVLAYGKYLPQFGIEIVHPEDEHFDLVAGHAGGGAILEHPFVCHIHGLHWSADYPCETWQYYVNRQIIDAVRVANEVTVPSVWVAESFQRDMRFTPHIIPHGIDVVEWGHDKDSGGYVLYNKNRNHDVCDATAVVALAQRFPRQKFVTTFLPRATQPMNNVNRIGAIPHDQMKQLVQSAMVYLSVIKETWCIGVLEAMAAGVPVLAFDYGGNSILVEHGRNGYLARPGDFDDLAEGLKYCAKYRDKLGKNGREMAREWTWERAVEMVAGVYRLAVTPEPPTVAVVIPHYNIGVEKLERAIESVRNQSISKEVLSSIIIVDDGSSNAEQIKASVDKIAGSDGRIGFIRQTNSGVASARNAGIASVGTKHIACLDADDAIAPEFIERCIRELEADRSLGIAYTGLWYIKPDGQEGLSKWPGEWNFDAHLQGHNQVPTCTVFRREAWERVGGYKSRYCPSGAGEEDAEFYLRLGAYGYKAKKVDGRGLFLYSWQSGRVSGDKNHQATDWTAWHPWAGKDGDGKHPFGSYATPDNHSHPVRQYDEPTISVIIPVGTGHEQHVTNALDSLEAQTFRQWEAIVVDDTDEESDLEEILTPYPYVHYIRSSDESVYENREVYYMPQGAGYARNRGAEIARAPLVLFLDADDWLYPTALEKMLYAWNEYQSIIYTDYTNRAIVDDAEVEKLKSKDRWLATLKSYEDGTHLVVSASESFDYDCERAQLQPQPDAAGNCYIWCTMMSLIPLAWHNEVGGFDEKLPSWEDVDYHWRLAKLGKCYYRIAEQLLVYNYHMGNRRERGRQNYETLLYYLIEKHKEIDVARGCDGCSKRPKPRSSAAVSSRGGVFAAQRQQSQPLPGVDDKDFVNCWRIDGGNISQRVVIGAALHDKEFPGFNMVRKGTNPDLWAINYGYFGGGRRNKVLVHRKDIKAHPSMWEVIEDRQAVAVPAVEQAPLGAPELISAVQEPVPQPAEHAQRPVGQAIQLPDDIVQELIARGIIQPGQQPTQPAINAPLQEPDILVLDSDRPLRFAKGVEDNTNDPVAREVFEQLRPSPTDDPSLPPEITTAPIDVEKAISGRKDQPPVFELQKIPGVNVNIAEGLVAAGCKTREDVAALGVEGLMAIKGIGEKRVAMILRAASSSSKTDMPT